MDGGGLRGILPAGMLEGVEDVIKEMAINQELVGTNEDNKPVQLTKDTKLDTFSVLLADYFDVCAGELLNGRREGVLRQSSLVHSICMCAQCSQITKLARSAKCRHQYWLHRRNLRCVSLTCCSVCSLTHAATTCD